LGVILFLNRSAEAGAVVGVGTVQGCNESLVGHKREIINWLIKAVSYIKRFE